MRPFKMSELFSRSGDKYSLNDEFIKWMNDHPNVNIRYTTTNYDPHTMQYSVRIFYYDKENKNEKDICDDPCFSNGVDSMREQ